MKPKNNNQPRNDELINYLLRSAKNVERKMLCEVLSRLSVFEDVKEYQYVGFGSIYFADFTLFHKVLGIYKLISIEGDESMEIRVRFNQPYSCVEILPGWSIDMLPGVDLEKHKSILWLDYTESLKGYMFKDMATFFNRAPSGSVFLISVNVDLKDEVDVKTTTEKITKKLNSDADVRKKIKRSSIKGEMKKEDYYSIVRGVIDQEIEDIITERNKTEVEEIFNYNQIFNFLYKDGQAMLTVGGILFSEKDREKLQKMNLNNFDFFMSGEKCFEIKVPHLTNREIYALDKHLPSFNSDEKAKKMALEELKGVISDDAIHRYAEIYRYYPSYTEANI